MWGSPAQDRLDGGSGPARQTLPSQCVVSEVCCPNSASESGGTRHVSQQHIALSRYCASFALLIGSLFLLLSSSPESFGGRAMMARLRAPVVTSESAGVVLGDGTLRHVRLRKELSVADEVARLPRRARAQARHARSP